MKQFIVVIAFVAALGVVPAWADTFIQSQGQNQGQGQGQDQYQDQYQGQDQSQGQGQSQSQGSYNSNSNYNAPTGVGVGIGGSSGQTQSSSVNNEVKVPKQAPPASAPSIVAAPETCMGSTSVGASSIFGGVSFGTTWKSTDCERRMYGRSLLAIAEKTQDVRFLEAILYLYAKNAEVSEALAHAGILHPAPSAGFTGDSVVATPGVHESNPQAPVIELPEPQSP